MTEPVKEQPGFFGTYFEKDAVLKFAAITRILSWVVLGVYVLTWLVSFTQFLMQFWSGMIFNKDMAVLDLLNFFTPYLTQPLPGIFYFAAMQALAHAVLILMDIEENSRRAARQPGLREK